MGKKKPEAEKAANHERWLLTYADMITLLMTLFVVLYALSIADAKKFGQLAQSLRAAFMGGGSPSVVNMDGQIIPQPGMDLAQDGGKEGAEEEVKMGEIQDMMYAYVEKENLASDVVMDMEDRGLVIRLSEGLMFASGEATIKPTAYAKLLAIAKNLKGMNNYIRIEGHTDDVPVGGTEFRSNWQLSTERATRITEFLASKGSVNPAHLSALGYGEFRPLVPNKSDVARAQNRRVDIVILRSNLNSVEENRPAR